MGLPYLYCKMYYGLKICKTYIKPNTYLVNYFTTKLYRKILFLNNTFRKYECKNKQCCKLERNSLTFK